jgi:hypothetical protein
VSLRQQGQARFYRRRIDNNLNSAISIKNLILALVLVEGIFGIIGLPYIAIMSGSNYKGLIEV